MLTIGTCSKCGGPVQVPFVIIPSEARCAGCGAVAANDYGPVITMEGDENILKQERLGGEFEKILSENIWDLYDI